ncbi:hypothetical protein ACRARG_17535 [Pseudooceanicola sp. C21-150M6]|uniref:hypothetical protein n=1 Tax=Pseudooceanicola sp. C21-150M6 TaxID=3434355 RepID=UPI003D7FCB1E
MKNDRVLEDIWTGRIRAARDGDTKTLSRQLRALVPVHHVLLSAEGRPEAVSVLMDDVELMPAVPLGDVLTEELGLDVPYGAFVVLRDCGSRGPVSYDAGLIMGEVMLNLLRDGAFPMEQETAALYAMAVSCDRLVEASGFRHVGLEPGEFRLGLAASLGAYWSGARGAGCDVTGLFDRADFLRRPELVTYLRALDGSFAGADAIQISMRLMMPVGGTRGFGTWAEQIGAAVRQQLGPQERSRGVNTKNSQRN